jgi:hypothetical protein
MPGGGLLARAQGTNSMTKQHLALLAMTLVPACVYAVDGQVLINQATVNAAGGFPYKITQPGSYRLSGNLIVPNADTTAIQIAASFVTIDLNGFSIIGPTDCSGGFFPCANQGNFAGNGIETRTNNVYFNVAIRNGTIQGMGGNAILIRGDSVIVENMMCRSNGNGIFVFGTSENIIIRNNNLQRNAGGGIAIDTGLVSDNLVRRNGSAGIFVEGEGGLILRNNSSFNVGDGIFAAKQNTVYLGNVLVGNGRVPVEGGFSGGQNFCGTGGR